jgi:tetratricopeptide (TPR) repeat protein
MSNAPHDQIRRARALHQQGMLAEAGMICGSILRLQPNNSDALHLAGIVALQTGRPEQGIELIGKALRLSGRNAAAHSDLGAGLRALQRHEEALASYNRAIALRPDYARAYYNRAMVLADLQRHAEALASYDRAIALRPDHAEAHANRGAILAGLRRDQDALASYDLAIALKPDHARAHYNRGAVLAVLQRHADALASYDRAIVLQPDNAEAHINRGGVLADLQRPQEALASYDRAITLAPNHADAHYNRAKLLADLQRDADALTSFDRAIALRPDHADAYVNRGVVLARLQRPADALASHDRAIALRADDAEAYSNRGNVLLELRRHADALASYDQAIALRPDYANAHWNQSHCLLALGQFDRGWPLYEWRKRLDKPVGNRAFPQPPWLGEASIAGKILFIHWEQGLGDTLQFCRYATLAQALGARVVMAVQDPLRKLLGTLGPDTEIIGGNDAPVEFDCHCPMNSLPLAFGTTVETIPRATPYLAADPAAVAAWRERLAGLVGLRVGLCWAGSPRHDQPAGQAIDRRRSIALVQYAPLGAVTGANFVSLQKGTAAAQAAAPPEGLSIHDRTDELHDFADTAALIEALDLVITVDTSVAHLAGALGKPVWILNRFDACWRWLSERDDSPWYPSARLWHQQRPEDWDSVIAEVAAALHDLVRDTSGGDVPAVGRHHTGISPANGLSLRS